jgi:hypothetical protein
MRGTAMAVVAAASFGALTLGTAMADEKPAGAAERCIRLNLIRSTTVVDDRTILFYLRGGDVYVNYLPQKCPNLAREERFSYRVPTNQLCQVDTITVLQNFGFGLTPGATCKLGSFDAITREVAEDLKRGPRESLVETEQVEPIQTEDEASDQPSAEAAGEAGNAEAEDHGAANQGENASTADSPRQ